MSKPYLDAKYKTIDEMISEIPNSEEQIKKAEEIKNNLEKQDNEKQGKKTVTE